MCRNLYRRCSSKHCINSGAVKLVGDKAINVNDRVVFSIDKCYTLVLNAGCFDSAVRLRAGSLCGVLIMLIRHALHAFEKYGRDS